MTHYEILGIDKNANLDEIKKAYKDLIRKYHPDVYHGDKSYAEKKATELNIAYETLSDPEKKAEYDEEINPSTYSYTPPTYTYEYTPPKYDTPPSNYNDYRKTYSNDHNYNSRYANYHRNKTPNSNYTETTPFENKFINILDTNKIVVIILIFIIYITLLIFTFSQFLAFRNNTYTGTITNPQKVETEHILTNSSTEDTKAKNPSSFPNSYEDFDINDYVSDSELYSIYSQYFYSQFDSFEEFKEQMSKELYEYYSELY